MATESDLKPMPRPILSLDRVLQAAIGLADQRGLESLSMRKLAQVLGVEAMSLYYYVAKKDDILDEKNVSIIRELLTYIAEYPALTTYCIELISISKNLERVADLSTNIAEETIFIAAGLVIKHQGPHRPGGAEDGAGR